MFHEMVSYEHTIFIGLGKEINNKHNKELYAVKCNDIPGFSACHTFEKIKKLHDHLLCQTIQK